MCVCTCTDNGLKDVSRSLPRLPPSFLSQMFAAAPPLHTQAAADKAAAVEEEALRIVSNIQNFLEKFDNGARFRRTSIY
jgi:hypothetical protein